VNSGKLKFSSEMFDEKKFNNKKRSVAVKIVISILAIYFVLLVIFMGLYANFKLKYELVQVSGMSMQPTINPNTTEQKICDDWVYIRNREFARGEIVTFNAKKYKGVSDYLIKRVIATEYDYITIRLMYNEKYGMDVYTVCLVTSDKLDEEGNFTSADVEYLDEDYTTSVIEWTNSSFTPATDAIDGFKYEDSFYKTMILSGKYGTQSDEDGVWYAQVPQGEFFYLGDNREISSDSRYRGTDKVESIKGVVEIIIHDANDGPSMVVQLSAVVNYYGEQIGSFFSNLWIDLEKFFAI